MLIRLATKEDLPQVNALRRQVSLLHAEARPDMFVPSFSQDMENFIYAIHDDEHKHILVAQENDRLVAFACVVEMEIGATNYRPGRRFLEVDEFGVVENMRRKGIGRQLFDEIFRFAKSKNFNRVELNMWEFNESALKFYESIGFKTFRRYMECNL